jgi:hypothetical protein
MAILLENFGEQIYNFKHVGSFGIFKSGGSFPIEYLLTSFSPAELSQLTFAGELSPEKIQFELLMQRNIDEQRVRLEMEPYLAPNFNKLTPEEIQSRIVYFPPLLAAMVPTKGKTIENYYANESGKIVADDTDGQKAIKHIIREWHGFFKLIYFPSNHPQACRFQLETPEGFTEVGVQCEPVQLETCLASGKQTGVRLVMIDGQHRLFTLQKVYEKQPQLFEHMRVPVCILLAPKATLKKNQADAPARVPTVQEVFRHLFVDLNSTAQCVSGHFKILLSDNSLGNLICRQFCNDILNNRGSEGLAVIEWNIKTKRESIQLIRSYSLTSIIILYKALSDSIGHKKMLIKYLLKLDEVTKALDLTSGENDTDSEIQWNKISLSQKNIFEGQVKKYLVPCLELILFGCQGFANAFEIFCHHLNKLKDLAKSQQPESSDAQQVVNQILDYIPIKEGKMFKSARVLYRDFELAVKQEKQGLTLFQYALFQRALFEAWAQVLDMARTFVPEPYRATCGFVKLVDLTFQKQGKFFSFEHVYMQHIVFSGKKFLVKEETRKVLMGLLIAHLANPFYSQQVVSEMQLTETEAKTLALKLQYLGEMFISKVMNAYGNARKRYFQANFRVDLSLSRVEREELIKAEEAQKLHQQEVKAGKREKTEVSEQFDRLVDKHIKAELELVTNVLKKNLGVSTTA